MSIATLHDSLAAPTVDTDVRPRRIALYSHDTQGLGHIRRNLAIADALGTPTPAPDVLLVSGVREAGALPMPPNTDVLSLPALFKSESGHYGARSLSTSLDDLVELRAQTIGAALDVFQPDVLVVDKVARGAFGELEPALHAIAGRCDARVVLGLRDVLDDPATTRNEWAEAATTEALHEFFDAVWIYGDRRVFDPVREYELPASVAAMVHHTGYLAPPASGRSRSNAGVAGLIERPYALCLVGGGQDGERLATEFLRADLPAGTAGVVVAGPFMGAAARSQLDELAASRPDRHVLGFVEDCKPLLNLRATIDQQLVDVAAVQAKAVEGAAVGTASDGNLLVDLELDPDGGLGPSDLERQILARDGTVLGATQGLADAEGLVAGRRLVRVAAGVPVFGDAVVRDEPLRFVGTTVADGSGRIVVVATPIAELADAERALLAVFGPVALAGSAFAGLAGASISRRGLAPLARMAAEADAIGAYDLSQRLPVPARRDEIRQLGSTLNRMLDRLEAAVQRERDFAAEASHELRTPLAILRAEVELARAVAEPAAREGLDSALEEIDRLAAVVEDLLLLARAGAAAALDRRQMVDLGALTSAAVQRFDTVARARGVTLVASGTVTLNGNASAIERALANLVDNALRHTPRGGAVNILARPTTRGAILVVRDSGPGAEAQALPTLFDRYTPAASRPGSAGLGLSIVAAVAASHGGGVRARNLPEGGLEITVELVGGSG